jgi:pyruvate dehydrogenase E1 component beta subunit
VSSGDIIAEIETDKATMEVEAVDEGVVGKILVAEGTEGVKVNTPSPCWQKKAKTPLRRQQVPAMAAPGMPEAAEPRPRPLRMRRAKAPEPAARRCRQPRRTSNAEPEIPEGTEMVKMTVREALRDAMAEEMRRDDDVFLMGEEVAEYQGAYKVARPAGRVRRAPRHRHADHRARLRRLGVGAAFGGLKPIVEFMTFNFAMQAIDHIINSAAKTLYMSGGRWAAPSCSAAPTAPRPRGRPAQPGLCKLVCPCAGPEGGACPIRPPTRRAC